MISVLICTYNRSVSLRKVLASLARMTVPADLHWELIVVDNNSSDDTSAVVHEFAATSGLNVRYVFEGTQGVSHARNRGVCEAQGEIIAWTDDDLEVDSRWLPELLAPFSDPKCVAAGGKVLPVWPGPKPNWFYEDGPLSLEGVIAHFDLGDTSKRLTIPPFGANMAVRSEAFVNHGFFRTDIGRTGKTLLIGEETEFLQRLVDANETIIYVPRAIVHHPVAEERTRKQYAESWFYSGGKSQLRIERIPVGAVRYFGVPRYLLKMMLAASVKWFFTVGAKNRFRNKLRLYFLAGMIAESRAGGAADEPRTPVQKDRREKPEHTTAL